MIVEAALLIRRARRVLLESIAHSRYERDMLQRRVVIHQNARIVGAAGITIGIGTRVGDGAILAATNYGFDGKEALHAPPDGSICIGENCRILPRAAIVSFGGSVTLGDEVSLNHNSILYGGGDLTVGSRTRIAAGVIVIPSAHRFDDPNTPIVKQGFSARGISIGDDVWIGAGVTVLDGCNVGDHAVLGAGAVVTKDVSPRQIVAGVPARPIGTRGEPDQS